MANENCDKLIGYQIYIRSFCDSNSDGIGDLDGITSKLDYIASLGVNLIWICPFYDSPMDDNGYDVRDYYKVSTEYGDMKSLKNLIKQAHARGIMIFIDLVLNHTSDENEWFIKSEKKIEPYTDFYVWKNGKMVNGQMQPPNNWKSFFSGSAWKYSEIRKQYFLKIFSNKMPDINYESEIAFCEMEKVIDFYAELGIDGFRIDAISHIGKDLTFKDSKNPNKSNLLFSNRDNAHDYLQRFSKQFRKNNLICMGELSRDLSNDVVSKYLIQNELDAVFSFEHVYTFNKNHTINIKQLFKTLKDKYDIEKSSGHSVLFWLNHDYPRLLSKIDGEKDPKNAQLCLAGLMYFNKGMPVIYNGEELGMENYNFNSPEDFKDVNAKMLFENSKNVKKVFNDLKENTRDHSRTVMQWNDKKYAGFSDHEPWSYVNQNYEKCNVELEEKDENSMLCNYKRLLKCRIDNQLDIAKGEFRFFRKGKIIGYKILNGEKEILVVANLYEKSKNLKANDGEIVMYSNQDHVTGMLKPFEIAIIKNL